MLCEVGASGLPFPFPLPSSIAIPSKGGQTDSMARPVVPEKGAKARILWDNGAESAPGRAGSARVVAVGDGERLVEHGDAEAGVVVGDDDRRVDVEAVEVRHRPDAGRMTRGGDLDHRCVVGPGRVER